MGSGEQFTMNRKNRVTSTHLPKKRERESRIGQIQVHSRFYSLLLSDLHFPFASQYCWKAAKIELKLCTENTGRQTNRRPTNDSETLAVINSFFLLLLLMNILSNDKQKRRRQAGSNISTYAKYRVFASRISQKSLSIFSSLFQKHFFKKVGNALLLFLLFYCNIRDVFILVKHH